MKSIAIIGAGVTGLIAAFCLKRKGISVAVYEAKNRAGGVIQTIRENGFIAEAGANTILEASPKISEIVRDLNLESRKIYTNPLAKKRFIVRNKKPIALPDAPLKFLRTKLFSASAKLRLPAEIFSRAAPENVEESVAEFATRHFGREFLDYAADPFVAGIYAGNPQKLSVQHAFPKLWQLEQKHGSLIRGQISSARERKRSGGGSQRPKMFSFDEGLQVLTDALSEKLGDAIHFNNPVEKISQTADGWTLQLKENGREIFSEHSAVVFCGTACKLAELKIESRAPIHFSAFFEIRHPPVASVVLGFPRDGVAHALDGFGMLIPKIENFKILGTIFSSSLFPNRAPENFVTLAVFVGGERQPEFASLPPEEIIELVRADLRELLGVTGKPVFQHVALYPNAIPQYNVGYGKFKDLMNDIETKAPGLYFAGSFRDGVSLGDSILSGCGIAGCAEKFLNPK